MSVDPNAWLRVVLRCDGPAPGLADDVREISPGRARRHARVRARGPGAFEAGDTQRLEPRELFAQYYQHRYGADADEPLMKLFDELFEEVSGAPA